jgi:flavin-dependent dehydrogenase
MARSNVLIIGGGPAGSVAALTLLRLGHDVTIFEKEVFPRYRIGESFLPGTMSIFNRLGLQPMIDAAGFTKKPSATFLWGRDQAPWTFSFTTPKSAAEWIFDHAIQVKREEFDHLLLNEAGRRGAKVLEGCAVTKVNLDDPDGVVLETRQGEKTGRVSADYVIDASGAGSIVAKQLGIRRYDAFYRNLAVWSYFDCPDRFTGDLRGTTFSITFEDGWVWMIPLKGDLYSVGVIVDQSKAVDLQAQGTEAFYETTLAKCSRAMEILGDSKRVDGVRVVRDWSYDTRLFSEGRFFLSGDSACFTDPLFSQGVHLATQSAVCAAAAIDRLSRHPDERDRVHDWYGKCYGETYEQYHEFLASFYTFASFTEPDSRFWNRRRIVESDDDRFERRRWFERLSAKAEGGGGWEMSDFRDRASTMIALGRHQRQALSDEFSDGELIPARLGWISRFTKQLTSIKKLKWNGEQVLLRDYYKVDPQSFVLEPRQILANESGRTMTKYTADARVRTIFADLLAEPFDYRTLIRRFGDIGLGDTASQMIIRLFEAGLLSGFDASDRPVHIQDRLRFDGVGVEYEV